VSFCDCARLRARKAGACFGVSGAEAPVEKRLFTLTGTDVLLLYGKAAA